MKCNTLKKFVLPRKNYRSPSKIEKIGFLKVIEMLESIDHKSEAEEIQTKIYEIIEKPLAKILMDMEKEGVYVEQKILNEMSIRIGERLDILVDNFNKISGKEYNVNSTQQFLYDKYTVSLSNEGHIIIIDKANGKLLSFKTLIGDVDSQARGVMRDKILYIVSKDGRLNAIKIN